MKLDYEDLKEIIQNFDSTGFYKTRSFSVLLLWISAVLGILILIKVTGFFVTSARADTLIETAIAQNGSDTDDIDKYLSKSKEVADELKKKNLFAPPEPKQHPVKQVLGILGNEVVINGKWYKVGDKIGDATIVAIEPALVRIEWNGSEKTFAPIDATGAADANAPKGERPDSGRERGIARVPGDEMPMPGRRGGFGGFRDLSPEERAELRERFGQMRERWGDMSEQEREEFRAQMRGRFNPEQ